MKLHRKLSLACSCLLVTSVIAHAEDHGKKDHSQASKKNEQAADSAQTPAGKPGTKVEFSITPPERQIIQAHYAGDESSGKKAKRLPRGLAKKVARGGKLPPGWEKKMAKGEIIPADLYPQCQPLPKEIVIKLPTPPVGTILVTVQGKVARILEATHEILDVFDILPKPSLPKP